MPVALHGSSIDKVARSDLHLLIGCADPPLSVKDIQHLFAGMDMPMGTRSVLEVNEAHGHTARLLCFQESLQLGLARERADLPLFRFVTAHDLHRSPSFIVGSKTRPRLP